MLQPTLAQKEYDPLASGSGGQCCWQNPERMARAVCTPPSCFKITSSGISIFGGKIEVKRGELRGPKCPESRPVYWDVSACPAHCTAGITHKRQAGVGHLRTASSVHYPHGFLNVVLPNQFC